MSEFEDGWMPIGALGWRMQLRLRPWPEDRVYMVDLTTALSAEEWAAKEWRTHGYEMNSAIVVSPTAHLLIIRNDRPTPETPFARPTEFRALIALANHALPDSHPGKLTWEDVETLETIASLIPMNPETGGLTAHPATTFLRAHAAKLRALLPPPPRAAGSAGDGE